MAYKPKICVVCGKEFIPTGAHQKYCYECKIIVRKEEWRQYAKSHRLKHPEIEKQYYLEHREHKKQYYKQWRLEHPNYAKEYDKQYRQTEKGKEVHLRGMNKRRRNLGFVPLNKWEEGCVAHHIDKDRVIYMPEEYHSTVRHNLETGKNMALINALAWDYLIETSI